MELEEIKKEMLSYRDFYGGDFLDDDLIKNAKTKEELKKVIDRHKDHMDDMLSDANTHLDNFKARIGLNYI